MSLETLCQEGAAPPGCLAANATSGASSAPETPRRPPGDPPHRAAGHEGGGHSALPSLTATARNLASPHPGTSQASTLLSFRDPTRSGAYREGAEDTAAQARELGVQARAYKVDCSRREDIQRAAEQVKKDMGEVCILVNNAGVVFVDDLLSLEDHEIQKTFDVNILAHFWTVRAFLPSMLERNHGHIVTVASMSGKIGTPLLVNYSSSKFAAVGFAEALQAELRLLGRDGVRTTCLCPYFVNTGFVQNPQSRFVDVLEPEAVVSRLLSAILAGETLVLIPSSMHCNVLLKSLLPTRALQAIYATMAISFKTRSGLAGTKTSGEESQEPGAERGAKVRL
ncbi:estradiol 17-beta-dehydrogenase 11-like isoform X1 [Petromyzon marinus]|uniref:Short-chain dehydrogenase/reductase 3 n=1 Tax=Petromyzon marinus TaxID=7757 RepID=A0AAJ7SW78_PETMA|nr:estradiol 17-beta-dehydrogenase 11-like isoform X1 [Petromyzon marinus]